MNNIQKGFTLIELMIVVAIIGILAAISIPAYQDYIARSQMTEAFIMLDGMKTKVAENVMQDGICPTNGNDGIPTNTEINGKYVVSLTFGGQFNNGGGCEIIAKIRPNASQFIQNAEVKFSIASTSLGETGSTTWACVSTAKQKYIPKSCVGA